MFWKLVLIDVDRIVMLYDIGMIDYVVVNFVFNCLSVILFFVYCKSYLFVYYVFKFY